MVTFQDSHRTVFTFRSWLDLLGSFFSSFFSCTSVLDFHSKNLLITSKLLTQGYRYRKLRKTFGKFFRLYSELLSKFGDISFKEYLSKGISHPVFYGGMVYWLFNVTINDISVIYVTAHRCAGGLKKKLDLRSGFQRHRHFVGFFNEPVLAPTRDHPFYTVIPTHRPI